MNKTIWTCEKIKESFERFISENNRLPTAPEVGTTKYLPSSRYIQLKFGGLKKLRTELGYSENNFSSGTNRSLIAKRVNIRGRRTEVDLETMLINNFGEVFVHSEKIFNQYKTRVDFYIYTPDGNFGVDIFYPDSMRTLQSMW